MSLCLVYDSSLTCDSFLLLETDVWRTFNHCMLYFIHQSLQWIHVLRSSGARLKQLRPYFLFASTVFKAVSFLSPALVRHPVIQRELHRKVKGCCDAGLKGKSHFPGVSSSATTALRSAPRPPAPCVKDDPLFLALLSERRPIFPCPSSAVQPPTPSSLSFSLCGQAQRSCYPWAAGCHGDSPP